MMSLGQDQTLTIVYKCKSFSPQVSPEKKKSKTSPDFMFFTQLSPTVICRLHETIEVFLSESGTDPISTEPRCIEEVPVSKKFFGFHSHGVPLCRWIVTGKYY